jgi:origin recognition complex subunit 1
MNLPEQMMARVTSRLGLRRIVFHPYKKEQLETIIKSRLAGLDAFDNNAITLVAMKIASVSGDARRALELCR